MFGPAPSDLVLLTDPGLVLPPDFYGLARRLFGPDLLQAGAEVYGMARPSLPGRIGWIGATGEKGVSHEDHSSGD